MSKTARTIETLTPADLQANPVWQFANSDGRAGETVVRPVKKLPVQTLTGRVVGRPVRLSNGQEVWALLGNIDASNPRLTEHFLTLSVARKGKWFTMARYHDLDHVENGPAGLARFLGLPMEEIFPIAYDVSAYAKGDPAALAGRIEREPRERLSRAELIALAVP